MKSLEHKGKFRNGAVDHRRRDRGGDAGQAEVGRVGRRLREGQVGAQLHEATREQRERLGHGLALLGGSVERDDDRGRAGRTFGLQAGRDADLGVARRPIVQAHLHAEVGLGVVARERAQIEQVQVGDAVDLGVGAVGEDGLDEAHQRVTAVGVAHRAAQMIARRLEPRRVELDPGRPVGQQAQRETEIGDLRIERGHRAHC